MSEFRTVTVRQAHDQMAAGAMLLDVREPDEWAEAHVDGAVLIPVDEVEWRHAEIPRDREVLLFCRSSRRSANVQEQLAGLGITNTANVEGGILAWQEAGLPVVTGA